MKRASNHTCQFCVHRELTEPGYHWCGLLGQRVATTDTCRDWQAQPEDDDDAATN
jgi:hypothetical protein